MASPFRALGAVAHASYCSRVFAPSLRHVPNIATRTVASSLTSTRALARQWQRGYADEAAPKRVGKVRRTFRWLWRLTYLSILGGAGYVVYMVWLDRHPEEQSPPDPSKKTLVILGLCKIDASNWPLLTRSRYWMGLGIPPEEARHRELQCGRGLPAELLPLHSSSPIMHHRHHRAPLHHGAYPDDSAAQESTG